MYNKYLDIFVEVANQGSFSKASEKLFISSTAIMKQMNLMENDLGVKLFERTNQGIKLTEAGRQIYKDAKHIIDYSKKAIANVQKLQETKNTIITVGTSIICPCKPLMDIWYKVSDSYPNYKIKIVPFEDTSVNSIQTFRVKDDDFDLIISPNDSAEWKKSCNFLELGKSTYVASMPRNHRLASKKVIDWKDFNNETIMMITEGDSPTTNSLRDTILTNSKNVTIDPVSFLYNIDAFNRCEEKGYILMSLNSWEHVHPSLVSIPLKQEFKVPYGIVYAKEPSKEVEKFIEIIKKNI